METRVTKRDMYEIIKEAALAGKIDLADVEVDGITVDGDAIIDFCEKEIEALDKKKVAAKARADKKKEEGDELTEAVKAALGADFEPIDDIAARVDFPDCTKAKVQYRLGKLAKDGFAERADLVVEGDGKKRKIAGYKLAD